MVSSHGNGMQESREKFLLLELTTEPSVLPTQLQKSRKDIKEGIKNAKENPENKPLFLLSFLFLLTSVPSLEFNPQELFQGCFPHIHIPIPGSG